MSIDPITRVIFNFTSKCNLPCDFCYIPFNNIDNKNLEYWKQIIDRCKILGAEVITFGGGDPFLYRDFPKLLEYSFDGKTFLQIDTNALALRDEDLVSILKYANLIGLPLEGLAVTHNKIRGNNKHYQTVIKWLSKFSELKFPTKINTVVSKQNCHELRLLANTLSNYNISKWSLYQFWALAKGKIFRQEYELASNEYLSWVEQIAKEFPQINIEISSVIQRHNSYFFVSHTGTVYVMAKTNQEEYLEIGNIFDKDIVEKWSIHGSYKALKQRTDLRNS